MIEDLSNCQIPLLTIPQLLIQKSKLCRSLLFVY